jgi:hypothetical protein
MACGRMMRTAEDRGPICYSKFPPCLCVRDYGRRLNRLLLDVLLSQQPVTILAGHGKGHSLSRPLTSIYELQSPRCAKGETEKMSLPGFTAESVLVERKASYASVAFQDVQGSVRPQARNTGGGTSNEGDCVGRYMKCVIGCYDKSEDYRQGCIDSCRASLNLCQSFLRPSRAQVGAIGRAPSAFLGA